MKKQFRSILYLLMLGAIASAFTVLQNQPSGLSKGDKAPDFEGKDVAGKTIKLKDQLKSGPVVVVFYRGQWCPYCNKFLGQLADSLKLIQAKGATVVAITPETLEGAKQTIEKTKAGFPVIHDEGLVISKKYKVNYAVEESMQQKLKNYGIDLNKANGDNGNNLPIPATYIIGKNGVIKYVYFNPDHTKRPPVKEILDNI